jgi:hypothetical protein
VQGKVGHRTVTGTGFIELTTATNLHLDQLLSDSLQRFTTTALGVAGHQRD